MSVKRNDILWKGILEDFFAFFLRTIFSDADRIFNFSKGFVFMDKELAEMKPYSVAKDPKSVDKLVGVHLRQGKLLLVRVHVEVETLAKKEFKRRMFRYFSRLFDKHDAPVISIAIFLGKKGRNTVPSFKYSFHGTEVDFKFNAVHVGELDEYLLKASSNPFSKVFLAAKLALCKNIPVEELLDKKLEIAEQLLALNLSAGKIQRLIDFLKTYIHFDEPEINNKFEARVNLLTNNKTKSMGITEQILDLAKQEGEAVGIKKGIKIGIKKNRTESLYEVARKMSVEGFELTLIHKMTSIPLPELRKLQKQLACIE